MLKDLLSSISSPFANVRAGSPTKQGSFMQVVQPVEEEEEEFKPITLKRRSSHMLRRSPRKNAAIKATLRTKKSNSLSDPEEETLQVIQKYSKLCHPEAKTGPINILVVGAKNVGKSALTVRFITRRYIGEYMSGENQTYNYTSPDEKRQQPIVFLDESTSSKCENCLDSQLSDENLTWADGVIVVYDVGDIETFNYAKNVISVMTNKWNMGTNENATSLIQSNENNNGQFSLNDPIYDFKPILLLGNKMDLVKRRVVSEDFVKREAEDFPEWVSCNQLSAAEECDRVVKCVNDLIYNVREKRRILSGLSAKDNIKQLVGSVFRPRSIKIKVSSA